VSKDSKSCGGRRRREQHPPARPRWEKTGQDQSVEWADEQRREGVDFGAGSIATLLIGEQTLSPKKKSGGRRECPLQDSTTEGALLSKRDKPAQKKKRVCPRPLTARQNSPSRLPGTPRRMAGSERGSAERTRRWDCIKEGRGKRHWTSTEGIASKHTRTSAEVPTSVPNCARKKKYEPSGSHRPEDRRKPLVDERTPIGAGRTLSYFVVDILKRVLRKLRRKKRSEKSVHHPGSKCQHQRQGDRKGWGTSVGKHL